MYFSEAKRIVIDYVDVLNFLNDSTGNIAHDERLLKNSKRAIILAFKVYMANVAVFRFLTMDECEEILKTLNRLDSFVTKDEADYYNRIHRIVVDKGAFLNNDDFQKYSEFFTHKALFCKEHDDIVNILTETQKYAYSFIVEQNGDYTSHQFYVHIYTNIIGIYYIEEFGQDFCDGGCEEREKRKIDS